MSAERSAGPPEGPGWSRWYLPSASGQGVERSTVELAPRPGDRKAILPGRVRRSRRAQAPANRRARGDAWDWLCAAESSRITRRIRYGGAGTSAAGGTREPFFRRLARLGLLLVIPPTIPSISVSPNAFTLAALTGALSHIRSWPSPPCVGISGTHLADARIWTVVVCAGSTPHIVSYDGVEEPSPLSTSSFSNSPCLFDTFPRDGTVNRPQLDAPSSAVPS